MRKIFMKKFNNRKRVFKAVFPCSAVVAAFVLSLCYAVPESHAQENSVQASTDSIWKNEVPESVETGEGQKENEWQKGEDSGSAEQKADEKEENEDGYQEDGKEANGDGHEDNGEKIPETDEAVYTDHQGITYFLDGDACYVSGYTQDIPSSIVIPQQIEAGNSTYIVKGIQKQAFSQCTKLKKIEIPNSAGVVEKGTFSGCRNLSSISIVPVKYSIKGNGKTGTALIRINSVLLGEADNVCLKIHKEIATEAASQKEDTIAISVQAEGGSVQHALLEQVEFGSDAIRVLSKHGKALKVNLTDTNGEKSSIMLDKNRVKQLRWGLKLKFRKQKAGSTSGKLKTDLLKALEKNGISKNKALVYHLTAAGGEKTGASLVLPVGSEKAMKAGNAVYVYRYSKSRRDFAAVLYHPPVVGSQGNLRIFLDKGGIYILSAKPFRYMCRKLANQFITESGSTYYIGHNGQTVCGWAKLRNGYYYFDRENGKMASGRTIDGIRLTKTGQATAGSNIPKIQTMIKARNIMLQVTSPQDTLEQKLEKCFRWIFQFPYRQYRRLSPIYRQAGWEVTFANDIFDRRKGCCVSEASAAAFLFHECGCKTVYVATDTGHAWVELNGRVYDPLFAEARGFDRYYNRPYEGYGMYAVVKHKI